MKRRDDSLPVGCTRTKRGYIQVTIGDRYVGSYTTVEDAAEARRAAEREIGLRRPPVRRLFTPEQDEALRDAYRTDQPLAPLASAWGMKVSQLANRANRLGLKRSREWHQRNIDENRGGGHMRPMSKRRSGRQFAALAEVISTWRR